MIIMGIDPGTARTGYALIQVEEDSFEDPKLLACDCIITPAGHDMHLRLHQLHTDLTRIVRKQTPDIMIIERLFFNTNVKTALTVGQARGIPLLVAGKHRLDVVEYTALQAKKVLAGYGRANKKDMQEAVKKYMNFDEIIKSDDANDALAMALCYLHKDHPARNNQKKVSTEAVADA
jgi:crossover junction endodeoxyribonuclease RuvC